MKNAFHAIAWQFSQRHVVALCFSVFSLTALGLLVASWNTQTVSVGLAVLATILPIIHLIYFIAVFGFGSDCDLLGNRSTYPEWMMRLPFRSRSLVLLPFFIGATWITGYWALTWRFIISPLMELVDSAAYGLPMTTTPLVFVATLAWVQATLWSNYRSTITRSIATLVAMVGPVLFSTGTIIPNLSERVTDIALLSSIFVAVWSAIHNLHLARQGQDGGWFTEIGGRIFGRPDPSQKLPPSHSRKRASDLCPAWVNKTAAAIGRWYQRQVFGTPIAAQTWYEWRRYCLPIAMIAAAGILLFFLISLTWPSARQARVTILILPWVVCGFGSYGLGGLNHNVGDHHISTFFSSRPFASAQFVGAKWRASAICSLLVCTGAVLMFAAATRLADDHILNTIWSKGTERFPPPHLWFGLAVGTGVYVFLTWVLLVQALPVKFSGRNWLQTLLIVVGTGLFLLFLIANSVDHGWLLPWTLGFLFLVKLASAILAVQRLRRNRLVSHGTVTYLIQNWCLVV
ncbi:MAG: hypothetical protein AAF989_10875, partial [Planctomycetota bacterium]